MATEASKKYVRTGKGRYYHWANTIKSRAKAKNIPCDIDADYLMSIMPTNCPILGCKLEHRSSRKENNPNSPQVDRIVPEKGYVKGNVRIMSRRANGIISDASLDEIKLVVKFLEEQYNSQQ